MKYKKTLQYISKLAQMMKNILFNSSSQAQKKDLRTKYSACTKACKAMGKQIPKKVIFNVSMHSIYNDWRYVDFKTTTRCKCPTCNSVLLEGEIEKSDWIDRYYCNKCGQKLDWK